MPGQSGFCADVSFFGFDGTGISNLLCASTSTGTEARVDAFDEFDTLPDFLDPRLPIFASVEVKTTGNPGAMTEFTLEHRSMIGMLPLGEMPPVGANDLQRFLAIGSEAQVTVTATKDGASPFEEVPIEIELVQEFELIDPIESAVEGELGTFFLIELVEVETGVLIDSLLGSSSFDSESDLEPDFGDDFAPGYEDFTNSTNKGDGVFDVEFSRTLEIDLEIDTETELTTLESLSIIADGFEHGEAQPWRIDSSNTFTFRVSSPDPDVRFKLNLEPTAPEIELPTLDVAALAGAQLRLSWEAVAEQNYTVLSTTDLALPKSQWQTLATVSGASGAISRDFPINGEAAFYVLQVTLP